MKKLIYTAGALMVASASSFAQPVHDRAVIPVAVTLNQVLRLHVSNGGNIEFVFNTIDQYKQGLGRSAAGAPASGDFYETNFDVASSTNWFMLLGAEDPTLIGTDNTTTVGVPALNNIGFRIIETGGSSCCVATSKITSAGGDHLNTTFASALPNGLSQYTGAGPVVISAGSAVGGNTGDELDNIFEILWECGTTLTTGTTDMNTTTLLDQSLRPDRYVTNVFLDIDSSNP